MEIKRLRAVETPNSLETPAATLHDVRINENRATPCHNAATKR
jgi:hypothetical protein